MQYRKMGKSGVRLSCLGVGSYLTIGMKMDDAASREVVRFAYDNGINYFDTADAYNKGQAEISLGKILADFPRSSIFLLTKLFWPMGPGPNDRGLSAKHIRESCDASLKRLRMDYVDLLMCHRPDPDTALEETIRAMEDLARQGKIIYWGVSEWPPVLIQQAQAVAAQMNARAMGVSQPRYSLLWREPEKELFPLTAREGIGNVTFSPLAHGTLTGKYLPGRPAPAGTRAADPETNSVIMSMYWKEEQKQASQEFVKIAAGLAVTAAQLAAAWCLRRPEVTSVILGISRLDQLKENLKAVELEIPPEVLQKLDALFPATAV
jgi:voltage-dependent potassium channel beta subunit